MYFPYLYGREAELLAIREQVSDFGAPQQIFPIIEPVKPAPSLRKALATLRGAKKAAYVIVNPHQGDLKSMPAQAAWRSDVAADVADAQVARPTFRQSDATSLADLQTFVGANPNRHIGVVLTTNSLAPADVAAALAGSTVVVFLLATVDRSAYNTALTPATTIDVEDNFQTEARNADYVGTKGQGTNHLSWTGRAGFGDYTILPSVFKDGGGPTGAVAVHLTYEEPAELRVQHFVSSITTTGGPAGPKFAQALGALTTQIAATPKRFRSSPALQDYLAQAASGRYTSPEKNKRLQIAHHLFTVARHLGL